MKIKGIFLRYLIIILAGLGNLWIFYFLFTPITSILVFSLTNQNIELIPACIAGAAYYLLFILAMSVQKLTIKRRILTILFLFLSFLILNVLRIVFLASIIDSPLFDILHKIFWYALSTIFVVGLWIIAVKIFKIKSIPIYDDFITIKNAAH